MTTQNPYLLPYYAGKSCFSGRFRDLQITKFRPEAQKANYDSKKRTYLLFRRPPFSCHFTKIVCSLPNLYCHYD
jgi:hypothetical protein